VDYVRHDYVEFMQHLRLNPIFDDKVDASFVDILTQFKNTQTW